MHVESHPKRTTKYHPSWVIFEWDETEKIICAKAICDALEKVCKKEYYVKHNHILVQNQDAVLLRLKGFLDLDHSDYCGRKPLDSFSSRITLLKKDRNTKAADIARKIRKQLPDCKVKSKQNPRRLPNGMLMWQEGVAGHVYIDLPERLSKKRHDEIQNILAEYIEKKTLTSHFLIPNSVFLSFDVPN